MTDVNWCSGLRLFLCALTLAGSAPAQAARDLLAEALSLPVATGLAGARNTEQFAWIENAAGIRNIWVAQPGHPARRVTAYADD